MSETNLSKTCLTDIGGFTLIELMIVVTVIAILSAIALPSYDEYVRRGRRAEAQTQILQAAQYLERRYTTDGNYGETLPSGLTQSPATGTPFYSIAVVTNTPTNTTFTLTAVATGSMIGDRCGDFVLAHTGAKSVANASVGADQCWRR
jgi:type IV pilus assembly protein PilE